jgi:hypothetical protein
MSNKPTNIDLTKWRGVTFTNNSLKMDVFLINGASVPMASRPLGPIGKPAIFQNKPSTQKPQKLKPIQSKRNFSRNRTGSVKGNRKSQVSNKRLICSCTTYSMPSYFFYFRIWFSKVGNTSLKSCLKSSIISLGIQYFTKFLSLKIPLIPITDKNRT